MRRICFDFDGVVHSYKRGWIGETIIPDPPVEGIEEVFSQLVDAGYTIAINSSRCNTLEGRKAILDWLIEYNLNIYVTEIFQCKPPALVYVDDRAILFDGNCEGLVEKIVGFKSWVEHKSGYDFSLPEKYKEFMRNVEDAETREEK